MDRSYDFSPLDDPIPPGESLSRRREMLGGRRWAEMSALRGGLLLLMILIVWPVVLITAGSVISSLINWVAWNGPTQDWGWGTPLLIGAIVVAVGLCVALTRLILIPPTWGRWVRMHRFAELNGMTFLRSVPGGGVAGLPHLAALPGQSALTDVFTDPVAGFVLGNAGAGMGAQAFILIQPGVNGMAPIDAQVFTGFTVRERPEGRLATRYRSVQMRDSTTVRRMFATADAVMRGDDAEVV